MAEAKMINKPNDLAYFGFVISALLVSYIFLSTVVMDMNPIPFPSHLKLISGYIVKIYKTNC